MLLYKKINCEKGKEGEEKSMNVLLTEMCLHVLWYVVVRENREQSHHYTQTDRSWLKAMASWLLFGVEEEEEAPPLPPVEEEEEEIPLKN
jgi:hypothetical protein